MTTKYTGALAELLEGLEALGVDMTGYKYAAMDMDNEVYLYVSKPVIGEHGVCWNITGWTVTDVLDRSHMMLPMTENFSRQINWRDSLTKINQQGEAER